MSDRHQRALAREHSEPLGRVGRAEKGIITISNNYYTPPPPTREPNLFDLYAATTPKRTKRKRNKPKFSNTRPRII